MVTVALTLGDPAGIGPELCVRAVGAAAFAAQARFVIYGPESVWREAMRRFGTGNEKEVAVVSPRDLAPGKFTFGEAAAVCGLAAYDALTAATLDAIAGRVDALVTAPMNKYAVNLDGIAFTGHTERIAELCNCNDFAMMQSAGNLRVAFVTTHIALREVPDAVTPERIFRVGSLLAAAIRAEGIKSPRLAAAALNPHAGENGCMGSEDETVVKPALARLNASGIDIAGPFPPDVLFVERIRSGYDGLLSLYHDQGHIPFKMLAFDRGVNSTLGLPIIRTSPDHGTACDIAWRGVADTGSFFAAIALAIRRASGRSGTII